jgi:hypothetical protein
LCWELIIRKKDFTNEEKYILKTHRLNEKSFTARVLIVREEKNNNVAIFTINS